MGMSASQVRLLSITARKSDNEFQAQAVSNSRIRLASETEDASKKYLDALSKKTVQIYTYTASGKQLTDISMSILDADVYRIRNNKGVVATKPSDDTDQANYTDGEKLYMQLATNSGILSDGLQDGTLMMQKASTDSDGNTIWNDTSIATSTEMSTTTDDAAIAVAEAEYEATTQKIQTKDKRLELELKDIETEHSALQTEYDSVKKVIDKNIEVSFKLFNG